MICNVKDTSDYVPDDFRDAVIRSISEKLSMPCNVAAAEIKDTGYSYSSGKLDYERWKALQHRND